MRNPFRPQRLAPQAATPPAEKVQFVSRADLELYAALAIPAVQRVLLAAAEHDCAVRDDAFPTTIRVCRACGAAGKIKLLETGVL